MLTYMIYLYGNLLMEPTVLYIAYMLLKMELVGRELNG